MRYLLIFMATCLYGQVTGVTVDATDTRRTSATAITATHLYSEMSDWGFYLDVAGTGAVSVVDGGTCSHRISTDAATAPTKIRIHQYPTSVTTAVGSTSCTIAPVVNGTTYTITVTSVVVRRWVGYATNPNKVADSALGCSKLASTDDFFGQCSVAQSLPGGSWTLTPVAGSYTDPNFGGVVTRKYTDKSIDYSSKTGVSKNGTWFSMGTGWGRVNATGTYRTSDNTRMGTERAGFWSRLDDNIFYAVNDESNTISKTVITPSPYSVAVTTAFTYPTAGRVLWAGGNADVGPDDDIAFRVMRTGPPKTQEAVCVWMPSQSRHICYMLANLPTGEYEDVGDNLQVQISPCTDRSGWRYMAFRYPRPSDALNRLFIFKYRANSTELEVLTPIGLPKVAQQAPSAGTTWSWNAADNPVLSGGAHSDIGCFANEAVYIPSDTLNADPDYAQGLYGINLTRLNELPATVEKFRTVSQGGIYVPRLSAQRFAEYPATPLNAGVLMVTDFYQEALTYTAKFANNIVLSGGNTIATIDFTAAHGFSGADAVYCSDMTITGLDGVRTVATVVDSDTITINGTFGGSYTAATGACVRNLATANFQTTPLNFEVDIIRIHPGLGALNTRRLAKVRSIGLGWDSYQDAFTRGGFNQDGTLAYWTDNEGITRTGSTRTAATGMNVGMDTPPWQIDRLGRGIRVDPSTTTALFTAFSTEGTCSITYSINIDLTSGTTISVTGGKGQVAATGLSTNTTYYWRGVCGEYDVVGDVFKTLPSQSGSKTLYYRAVTPAGATSAVVDFGTTSSLGSTTGSVSCTAGQLCSVPLSATAGTVIWARLRWSTGAQDAAAAVMP